ncbi:hypothetical protein Adu01nite_37440 [Paractinoplanes durhamensis]|uniref:Secreted protein n=1 Tax=Paractinoplanes durhamensis TaxID=113563 RepID=A0ABQ3YXZ3_9ACTN|nr:hypothetical protein Adu01nite_37440 [Actinoplanes durhamensis]
MFWKTCATVAMAALTTSAMLGGTGGAAEAAPSSNGPAAACPTGARICVNPGTAWFWLCKAQPEWCSDDHSGHGGHQFPDDWDHQLPDDWDHQLPDDWTHDLPDHWVVVLPPEADLGSLLAPQVSADLPLGNDR